MNNLMNRFSKYAISKKHTLNVIGGYQGSADSQECPTCSRDTNVTCVHGCGMSYRCPDDLTRTYMKCKTMSVGSGGGF
ncbi:MAG: hypothetical protein AAGA77_19770 [Bacteroidota bacterium]